MTDSDSEKDIASIIRSAIEKAEKETGAKITPGPLLKIDENTTQEDIEEHRRKFLESFQQKDD